MGKSSRQKRRTYQTPKRSRTNANFVWYVATAILVLAGTLGVVLSRTNSASGIGPTSSDHWHAALGVDDCGKWAPNWLTPVDPSAGTPVRSGSTIYAGMHSHGDGLIHMEPQSSADTGKHATVGEYFKFAGFKVNATSIKFGTLDPSTTVIEKNGNKCDGKPGVLRWAVNGKEKTGDPGKYKIFNGDVIEIVFTTADAKLPPKTAVPSYAELQNILGNPNKPETPPGVTVPNNAATTTTPAAPTTTAAGSTTTAAGSTTTGSGTTPP
jgi:hypothetical protein